MRGTAPVPTWAAASSINMNPQTCLPVSAEGEEDVSPGGGRVCRWGTSTWVGEVSALAGRVWGGSTAGGSVCLELGESGGEGPAGVGASACGVLPLLPLPTQPGPSRRASTHPRALGHSVVSRG